jgi:hypothetical protein
MVVLRLNTVFDVEQPLNVADIQSQYNNCLIQPPSGTGHLADRFSQFTGNEQIEFLHLIQYVVDVFGFPMTFRRINECEVLHKL